MRWMCLVLLIFAMPVHAQRTTSDSSGCETMKGNPLIALQMAYLRRVCRNLVANSNQQSARLRGAPRPSLSVVKLPEYGTARAEGISVVCMSGQAMRRLPNGWEQLVDEQHNWQRCQAL